MSKKKKDLGRSPAVGIGKFINAEILKGRTNQAILESVVKKFPSARTRLSNIAWYRNKLRTGGAKGVKTNRQLAA